MCRLRWGTLLAAGLTLVLAGCGGKRLYPVEGVVKYDDGSSVDELDGGTVSLESVADRSNAAGEIGPNGRFRIRGPMGEDGAAAGAYRVLVLPPPSADRNQPPIDPVLGRYRPRQDKTPHGAGLPIANGVWRSLLGRCVSGNRNFLLHRETALVQGQQQREYLLLGGVPAEYLADGIAQAASRSDML